MLRFASTLLVTLAGLTQVALGEVVWDRAELHLSSDEAITDQVSTRTDDDFVFSSKLVQLDTGCFCGEGCR